VDARKVKEPEGCRNQSGEVAWRNHRKGVAEVIADAQRHIAERIVNARLLS
jgi:hypothetical protein